jgi:hypothetical protein
MTKFFSNENMHSAGWAILIGILSFIGGILWKHFDGPDEVKIVGNITSKKDTTITIIKFEPTEANQNNYPPTNSKNDKKDNYQFNSAFVDSIIKKTLAKQRQILGSPEISTVSSSKKTNDNTAPLYRPKLNMPSIVSGYVQEQLNSYATISINKTVFTQNEIVELTADFFQKNTIDKITPLFVDVTKRNSENSSTLIWSDQFQPIESKTVVKFSASFKRDNYDLTIGFYLKDGLSTKYPGYYSKKIPITIN